MKDYFFGGLKIFVWAGLVIFIQCLLIFLILPYRFPSGGYILISSPFVLFMYITVVAGWAYLLVIMLYYALINRWKLFKNEIWVRITFLIVFSCLVTWFQYLAGFDSNKVSTKLAYAEILLIWILTGITIEIIHNWLFVKKEVVNKTQVIYERVIYDKGPYWVFRINNKFYIEYTYGHSNLRRSEIKAEELKRVKLGTDQAEDVIREAQKREDELGEKWIL